MPAQMRRGQEEREDRNLPGDGGTARRKGGAAYVGRTMYFRQGRFRNGIFYRM